MDAAFEVGKYYAYKYNTVEEGKTHFCDDMYHILEGNHKVTKINDSVNILFHDDPHGKSWYLDRDDFAEVSENEILWKKPNKKFKVGEWYKYKGHYNNKGTPWNKIMDFLDDEKSHKVKEICAGNRVVFEDKPEASFYLDINDFIDADSFSFKYARVIKEDGGFIPEMKQTIGLVGEIVNDRSGCFELIFEEPINCTYIYNSSSLMFLNDYIPDNEPKKYVKIIKKINSSDYVWLNRMDKTIGLVGEYIGLDYSKKYINVKFDKPIESSYYYSMDAVKFLHNNEYSKEEEKKDPYIEIYEKLVKNTDGVCSATRGLCDTCSIKEDCDDGVDSRDIGAKRYLKKHKKDPYIEIYEKIVKSSSASCDVSVNFCDNCFIKTECCDSLDSRRTAAQRYLRKKSYREVRKEPLASWNNYKNINADAIVGHYLCNEDTKEEICSSLLKVDKHIILNENN